MDPDMVEILWEGQKDIYRSFVSISLWTYTYLAMMSPTLPGYKVECVGDDIAWMKFDSERVLRAINPENEQVLSTKGK